MGKDPLMTIGIALLVIWTLSWKGFAMWKAAKNNQPAWFIAIFLVNALGILEIVYLSFFQKKINNPHPVEEISKKEIV